MNIWDVGGQKTIRNYWKNYFEEVGVSNLDNRLDRCSYMGNR